MDIRNQLKSKHKKSVELKTDSSIEKKLNKTERIGEHLRLQKEYSDESFSFPNTFLKSITNHKDMFTNKVTTEIKEGHINEHIIHNLKLIIRNPLYLTKNTEQVIIDRHNSKRLKEILSEYDKKSLETEGIEGINLFKVSGEANHVIVGKKKERMNAFRVYLKITDENTYHLLFVDPYHLVIPSNHNGHNRDIVRQRTFDKYKYYKEDLHKLLVQIES